MLDQSWPLIVYKCFWIVHILVAVREFHRKLECKDNSVMVAVVYYILEPALCKCQSIACGNNTSLHLPILHQPAIKPLYQARDTSTRICLFVYTKMTRLITNNYNGPEQSYGNGPLIDTDMGNILDCTAMLLHQKITSISFLTQGPRLGLNNWPRANQLYWEDSSRF